MRLGLHTTLPTFLLWCIFMIIGGGGFSLSHAGTFERNTVKGHWQLDDNLSPRYAASQSALVANGFTIGNAPNSRFSQETISLQANKFLTLNSSTNPFGGLKSTEQFWIPNPIGPNGPAGTSYTHVWTMVMDVRFPSFPAGGFIAILQDREFNGDDAEIFLNPSRQLQFFGANGTSGANPIVSDVLAANTWYRIAFTASYNSTTNLQTLRCYINGVPTSQTSAGQVTSVANGRYTFESNIALFTDDSNETTITHLGALAVWGRTLANDDIAAIGGFSPVLVWPGILASNSTPPLPALTGNIIFGDFVAQFTPPTGSALLALANSATASANPSAVCDVTLILGANGGRVAGFPNHSFGGNFSVSILANGDALALGGTNLNYTPPPGGTSADLGTASNVTLERETLTLDESTGLSARTLTVYFPAGMNIALNDTDMRARDRVVVQEIPLNQSLIPKSSLTFTKATFIANATGPMFPCTERIPVRFRAASVTYFPNSGQFTFSNSGQISYHQLSPILRSNDLATSGPTPRDRSIGSGNDRYYVAANSVSNTVIWGARSGGIATTEQLALSLDPARISAASILAFTHYPKMFFGWQGAGSITWSGNAIASSSNLPNAFTSSFQHATATETADSDGLPNSTIPAPQAVYFLPASRIWNFSPDGGLRAAGTLGSAYNSALDTPSGTFIPRWMGYKENGTDRYAQQIVTGFTAARVITAGNAILGSDISTPTGQQATALLHSGHSSPANPNLTERPATTAYTEGNADYPGINVRASSSSAVSRIAGTQSPTYPLANSSKYYIRPAGVSGVHRSNGTPFAVAAFGCDFSLSALNLAFLDGLNTDSGVTGGVLVRTPESTSFTLDFKKLLLGPQGQLAESTLANQSPKTLGYWNFGFTPLSLDFPQPKSSPPPLPSTGFVRISASAKLPALFKAANGSSTLTGTLGFANSDLVTTASPLAEGFDGISRFNPGSLLTIPGSDGLAWNFNCTSGIYLNAKASAPFDPASINAAGLIDLPFFNDIPVHLRTRSASGDATPSLLDVRAPISTATGSAYDSSHIGTPPGVLLTTYRSADYHPIASRKWQNLISFDLPVAFAQNSNSFRSQAPVNDDVFLFNLSQAIPKMTPAQTELIFEGKANLSVDQFLPQVNVASLLTGTSLGSSQTLVNGATTAITTIDQILGDTIQPLLKPVISNTSITRGSAAFLTTLKNSSNRSLTLDSLVASINSDILASYSITGQARSTLTSRISAAENSLTTAKGLVATASNLTTLATNIRSIITNSSTPTAPDTSRLSELTFLFDAALADLALARTSLPDLLDSSISLPANGASAAITAAINDLKAKWAPADPAQASALYASATASQFATELATAISDRLAGSSFAGIAQSTIRQQLADTQLLTRQTVDDTLAYATTLIAPAGNGTYLNAIGVPSSLGAASLKGYARFKGDSIDELRLDGKATIKVPDDMTFDAFFLFKTVDSSTPAGACLAAGGAAAEISMGASGPLGWAGIGLDVDLAGKVALNASGTPIGLFGDLKLAGPMDFSSVKMQELALGFGFGANNYYLYGKGAGKIEAMDIAAGVFFGKTCEIYPIENADPDIGKVVAKTNLTPPYSGAVVYAFGGMSLMPIIGIPPSCLLDLRVGGGQGFFAFYDASNNIIGGFKTTQSVTGELLCLASVTGQQDTVLFGTGTIEGGSPRLSGFGGTSRFTASGKVGVGYLSYTFKKSVGLNITAAPVKFSIDY